MRTHVAIALGKLIAKLTRTLKIGGGSAAPGLYALKVDPNLVEKLALKIPQNIVITGTNGKTTTSRMIAHFATQAGVKIVRNSTGSNLERGIASALIAQNKADLGIWELDEFAFNSVAPKLNPDLVLILNVSRDQLDRYGEVDEVVKRWEKTIQKLNPKTKVIKTFPKLKNIKNKGLNNTEFIVGSSEYKINLPGEYNAKNAVAAITAAKYLNLPINFKNFQPAFGRFEKLPFGYIFLIKNPAGATSVFETVAQNFKPQDRLLIALNDKFADGTDVSWIWDAEFEKLPKSQIIVSGNRAGDLAVRLKYAELKASIVEPNLKKALKQARTGLKGKLYILPTYTALLELQSILTKQGVKSEYWREQ